MDVKTYRRLATAAVLVILAGCSAAGFLEKAADHLGADRLHQGNQEYIDQSFEVSMKGFLILSAIKSGLAVIEGSEVGLGFNLEVGDLVQSVYDYVDIAWKTALLGGTVLLLTQMLFQAVALVNHWCLALALLLLAGLQAGVLFSGERRTFVALIRRLFAMTVILSVSLYILLPLSVRSAAFLSARITNPLMTEARNGFVSVRDDLSVETLSRKLFGEDRPAEKTWMDRLNPSTQYDRAKKHLADLGAQLSATAEKIAVWTVALIAGYLFDGLVFPLTFFLLLYLFARFSFDHLLRMGLAAPRTVAEERS
ncbi:hypothetical protein JCM14469_40570 [Desulfatiferula olefinivorans]